MSAPDTNIERQHANHKPSLMGIKGSIIFGALMLICVIFYAVINGQAPTEATMSGDAAGNAAANQSATFDTYAPGTNESN